MKVTKLYTTEQSIKMETSLLTVQDFIDATRGEYHNEIDNIHNVLKILDGKKDVIPLF